MLNPKKVTSMMLSACGLKIAATSNKTAADKKIYALSR
jgi:hypothetical protein